LIKKTLVIWIFSALHIGAALANPNPQQSRRTLLFELDDPRSSFDANTATWQMLNGWIARGADHLTTKRENDTGWARLGIFTAGLYLNSMLRYYSHEIAHEYVYRHNHISVSNSLNMQQWKSSYIPGLYYPAWRQNSLDPASLNDDEILASITSGLNQDKLNATATWLALNLRGSYSFYEAQAYLLTSLRDIDYIIRSKSEETPFPPGMQIHQLQQNIFADHPHLYDDVNLYRLMLLNSDTQISNRQLLNRSLFASVFSWQTWESFYAIANYLHHGQSTTPVIFTIGEKIRISPPLFSHYLANGSSFMNSLFMIKVADQNLHFELGSKLGFLKLNAFENWRIGVKVYNISLTNSFGIQPFIYLNAHNIQNFAISSVGLEGILNVTPSIGVWAGIQFNKDDILENEIKAYNPGIRSRFGLRIQL
jgi:hypothetical protein